MNPSVLFSEQAEAQLLEILACLSEESEPAAVHVRDAIYEVLERLARMPEMGHTRADLTGRPVRSWNVHSYLLVYDPAARPLTVVAVLHGARDLTKLLKDI